MTPREAVAAFQETIQELERHYDSLVGALTGVQRRATLEGILAEQFALELGVRWEGFIHDLFVSYVERNKRAFLASEEKALRESVRQRKGPSLERLVYLRIPSRPRWTSRTVDTLLDPEGRHLTLTKADDLSSKASRLLGSKAKRFSLVEEDRQLIDFVIALRNYLAHRSRASLRALNASISAFAAAGANHDLAGQIRNVRAYLRNAGPSGRPRIKVVFDRMSQIAGKLA